jgi:uncharacterized membrane protein YeaQ/YmgE (transglycosylase-associated protein family)
MLLIGLTWVAAGVAVGLAGHFLVPGRPRAGGAVAVAVLVGVVGAFLGGLVSTFAFRSPEPVGDPDGVQWPGVLMSVLGACLGLGVYLYARRSLNAPDGAARTGPRA